jgi:hypothetical protein
LRSTTLARIPVGVVVERRKAISMWADFLWRPVSVLAGSPSAAPQFQKAVVSNQQHFTAYRHPQSSTLVAKDAYCKKLRKKRTARFLPAVQVREETPGKGSDRWAIAHCHYADRKVPRIDEAQFLAQLASWRWLTSRPLLSSDRIAAVVKYARGTETMTPVKVPTICSR